MDERAVMQVQVVVLIGIAPLKSMELYWFKFDDDLAVSHYLWENQM